jgi:hypothetical protein
MRLQRRAGAEAHDAMVHVTLPELLARALVGGCPGLRVTGAYALGPPGLDETAVDVVFADVLDLTRLLEAEAVTHVEIRDPSEDQVSPDLGP